MSGSNSTDRDPAGAGAPAVLGVDIGGATVKAIVLDDTGVVFRRVALRERSLREVLDAVVRSAVSEHHVAAVGVGVAGLVEHHTGRFAWGPHLSDMEVDVASIVSPLVDAHFVDNDANCAAYAEWMTGPAHGHRVALTISIGTGIGAGLIVDGAIWRGSGFAGEVGHMRVTDADLACPCGRSGCWETLVSGRRLGLDAARLGLEPTAEALVRAARKGSKPAGDALKTAGEWLGVGIANLILVLDPSVVVVAGGLSNAGDLILDAARKRIASSLPGGDHRPVVEVVQASHGRWAASIGAARLAADRLNGRLERPEGDMRE